MHEAAQAREQAARAKRVSEFAKNTFLSASSYWQSPLRGKSRSIQFSDILDNAAERVGKELASDPLAEADLRGTLGATYSVLGDPVKGEAQILEAITVLRRNTGPPGPVAADLQVALCNSRSYQGRYVEALAACKEALALAREHGTNLWLGGIMHDTAFMAAKSGAPLEEAERLYRDAVSDSPKDVVRARIWPAIINTRIGGLRLRLGDLKEGDSLLRGAERLLRAEPGPPIEIVATLVAMAFGARVRGDFDQAIQLLEQAVQLLVQRPTAYMGRDQIELELAADEALADRPASLARLHGVAGRILSETNAAVDKIRTKLLAGIVEARFGSRESAERYFRSALETSEKDVPRQPADRVEVYLRLAELLAASKRSPESGDVARLGLHTAESAYGSFFSQHPFVAELKKLSATAEGH